jgi:hypothetical protein
LSFKCTTVGHLPVLVDRDAESLQVSGLDVSLLLAGVAQVHDMAARREAGAEVLDDLLDEFVLATGGQRDPLSIRELHWHERHLALSRPQSAESSGCGQERRQ